MAESARRMGIRTEIMRWTWWLFREHSLWYWKNLTAGSVLRIRRLAQMIRAQRIDLVYSSTATIFEPALAARLAGVPHLWHVHEVLDPTGRMEPLLPIRWIQRLIRRYASLVVFESESARRVFEAGVPLPRSEVVYNSLRFDADEFPMSREECRGPLGLRPDERVVAFVGQFIERKNPLLLVEALAKLQDRSRVVCLFAGEGPLAASLQEHAARHGLQSVCRFLPFQADIRPLLAAIDILVLPARQESFGLVLVEAAAFGKPVIACRSQGPNEIILDGQTGFLTPVDDAAALSTALSLLLSSDELRLRMGAAGRRRVQELFHPQTNTRRLERFMDELLEQASCGSRAAARN